MKPNKKILIQFYILLVIVLVIIVTHVFHHDIIRMYTPSEISINSYGLLYGDSDIHTSYELYDMNVNFNMNVQTSSHVNGPVLDHSNGHVHTTPTENELFVTILSPIRSSIVPLNNRLVWQIEGDLLFNSEKYFKMNPVNSLFNREITTDIYIDGRKLAIPFDGLVDNSTLASLDSVGVLNMGIDMDFYEILEGPHMVEMAIVLCYLPNHGIGTSTIRFRNRNCIQTFKAMYPSTSYSHNMQRGHYFYYFPDENKVIKDTVSNTPPPVAPAGTQLNADASGKKEEVTMSSQKPDLKSLQDGGNMNGVPDSDSIHSHRTTSPDVNASSNTGDGANMHTESDADTNISISASEQMGMPAFGTEEIQGSSMYSNPHVRSLLFKNTAVEDSMNVLSISNPVVSNSADAGGTVSGSGNGIRGPRYMHSKTKTISTSESVVSSANKHQYEHHMQSHSIYTPGDGKHRNAIKLPRISNHHLGGGQSGSSGNRPTDNLQTTQTSHTNNIKISSSSMINANTIDSKNIDSILQQRLLSSKRNKKIHGVTDMKDMTEVIAKMHEANREKSMSLNKREKEGINDVNNADSDLVKSPAHQHFLGLNKYNMQPEAVIDSSSAVRDVPPVFTSQPVYIKSEAISSTMLHPSEKNSGVILGGNTQNPSLVKDAVELIPDITSTSTLQEKPPLNNELSISSIEKLPNENENKFEDPVGTFFNMKESEIQKINKVIEQYDGRTDALYYQEPLYILSPPSEYIWHTTDSDSVVPPNVEIQNDLQVRLSINRRFLNYYIRNKPDDEEAIIFHNFIFKMNVNHRPFKEKDGDFSSNVPQSNSEYDITQMFYEQISLMNMNTANMDNFLIASLFEHVSNFVANETIYEQVAKEKKEQSNTAMNDSAPLDVALTQLLVVNLRGSDEATNFKLPTGFFTINFNLLSNHTVLNLNDDGPAAPETKLIAWDVIRLKRVKL